MFAYADADSLADNQLPLVRTTAVRSLPLASRSALTAALVVVPSEPIKVVRARQNRARRILAAGAGFMLSAAVTPIYVLPNRDPCWGSDIAKGEVPLRVAAVVGGVGVAMAAGGGTWLGLEARRHGYYATRRERLIDMSIGALTFALGQSLTSLVFFADQLCHS